MAFKCFSCGEELPKGERFKTKRIESLDREGRFIGATTVQICRKCFEKEKPVSGEIPIPEGQKKLF